MSRVFCWSIDRVRAFAAWSVAAAALLVSVHLAAAQEGDVVTKSISGEEVVRTVPPETILMETTRELLDEQSVDQMLRDEIRRGRLRFQIGEAPEDLELEILAGVPPRQVGNKWIGAYKLALGGIPLSDGSEVVVIRLEKNGATQVRERNLPKSYSFQIENGSVPAPTVDAPTAQSVALKEVDRLTVPPAQRAALPSLQALSTRLEIWVDPATAIGHLVWAFDLGNPNVSAAPAVRAYVSAMAAAGSPPAVFAVKSLRFYEFRGVVQAKVFDPTPLDQPLPQRPLSNVRIVKVPVAMAESEDETLQLAHTGADGTFQLPSDGSAVKLKVELKNDYFTVEDHSGTEVLVEVLPGDGDVQLSFDAESEFAVAQPSAFYWANEARKFAAEVLKDDQLREVRLATNYSGECNAEFLALQNRIKLFRASPAGNGRNCINKAYLDTVFHEYGHAIDYAFGGVLNHVEAKAYSEGFGDSLAMLFKNSSCYGRNHKGAGTCMRDPVETVVQFGEPGLALYKLSMVYSGFTWELLQALTAIDPTTARSTALSLTLQTAVLNPNNIKHAVELMLFADDDDLDLTNGTPHSREIAAAARSRGIPLPPELLAQ